jgi:hypothetical protein
VPNGYTNIKTGVTVKLKRVIIKNFRKLNNIDFSMTEDISVIVGPNAVGKSSVFEAIRLVKATLFPRANDELRHVMIALGATSAHFPQGQFQYDISALAGDILKPVSIALTIEFSSDEVVLLQSAAPQIARSLLFTQLGRQPNDPSVDLVAYLATPIGKQSEEAATKAVVDTMQHIGAGKPIDVGIEITATSLNGSNAINNLIIAQLEQRQPPDKTIFSYFPADRSLPVGEIAIQVGPQDFKAQLDSHFATATTKYGRLKQTVVNRAILARINEVDLKPEFDSIFETFLPGKEFIGLQQKPTGLVSVLVRDKASDKVFDIDSLSSGEKGLVLSFLLFRTSLVEGSIALVDELELHLNPAVCRKILPYLAENVAKKMGCQFIISTHSAEITRDAYDREDTELFHLRNGNDISPIFSKDVQEVVEAIGLLGVSTDQALTARGLIFVEGDSDIDILQSAFPELLSGIDLRSLNGRSEVEKSITGLQAAEQKGKLKEQQSFLFDNDRKKTTLKSTKLVKIEQLQRYCLENYLLDEAVLYDIIKLHTKTPPESRGKFATKIQELAMKQLDAVITNEILVEYRALRIGLKSDEIKGKNTAEIAEMQLQKIREIEEVLKTHVAATGWTEKFSSTHSAKRAEREQIWSKRWKELCSGKTLIEDLQREYTIHLDLTKFKCQVAAELARQQKHNDIKVLKGIVDRLLPT